MKLPSTANTAAIKNKRIALTITVIVFLTLVFLLWRFPLADVIDNAYVAKVIDDLGWLGIPIFILGGSLVTAVGLPRQLVSFIAGYSFGVMLGVTLATIAAIGGCFLCFWFSRRFLQQRIKSRYSKSVSVLNGFIKRDAFLKIIVLRLQPFGTNLITNLSAGVSHIPASVFIGSSLIGYIPQMLVFALLGAGVRVHSKTQMLVSTVLFIISLLLGWLLYKRHLNSLSVD